MTSNEQCPTNLQTAVVRKEVESDRVQDQTIQVFDR